MSFAYLALYTGDYLRDTRALTPLDHGVYLLLLMFCWDSRGPLPLDEQDCAGIANCRSATEIDSLRKVRSKFFTRMEDGWYNHRMQLEIERAGNISKVRSDAGKAGYKAKSKQLPSKSTALAKQVYLSPPPPPPLPLTSASTPKSEALAPRTKSALPLGNGDVIEKIPIIGQEEIEVRQSYAQELERLFPAVDVPQTLREIRAWNLSNPDRRKTSRGIARHITNWMQKVQNG